MSDETPSLAGLRAALRREQRKVELVRDIGLALGSTLDLDELLQLVAENVTELMEAERSTIYVVDEATQEIWSRVAQGEQQVEFRLPVGTGIAGWVAACGDIVNVRDAYHDDRFDPEWDKLTGYVTRSILTAPMRGKDGRVIGALQVLNKRTVGGFTGDDEVFIQAIAAQAAVSLENSQLVFSLIQNNEELQRTKVELEQRNSELDLLLELEQLAASARNLDDLLDRVIRRASALCDADAGAVLLLDSQETLRFEAAFGARGEEMRRFRLRWGEGIAGWVTRNCFPVRVEDASRDQRHQRTIGEAVGYVAKSVLCVPLRGHSATLGAIELLNKGGAGQFTEGDEKVLTLIAGQVARAVELARDRERRDREDRLATIGHLLSGVLHDLKTPMTVISGYVQLMAQAQDSAQRQGYAETVLKQFEHISAMTSEILAFARGESSILVRRVYLHRFVEEIGELLRRELEPRGIEVSFELEYKGTARFDEGKIRRVIHNIARNAAEAMPDGGTLSITVRRVGDDLLLRFADTGTGVPDEVRDRLFESFSTAGKEGGTGLGLAVVKKIVDQHRGEVSYESDPGKGTTFTVRLPLDTDSRAPAQAPPAG